MLTPAPFYFIRHGETDWNKLKLMQGQTDTPLNATGIFQAEAAAEIISTRKIVTICTSPLRRARQTAELISAKSSAPSIVTVAGLMEANFGSYEGHPSGPWRDEWLKGGEIPNGEDYEAFVERSLQAINECLQHPGPVLIVSHGGCFTLCAAGLWPMRTSKPAIASYWPSRPHAKTATPRGISSVYFRQKPKILERLRQAKNSYNTLN